MLNQNLKALVLVSLFFLINQPPVLIIFEPNMIKKVNLYVFNNQLFKGFAKESLTNIRTLVVPAYLITATLTVNFIKSHSLTIQGILYKKEQK